MRTEFSDDDALRGGFERERNHDATNVIPFVNNQRFFELADGANGPVFRILFGVLESAERCANPVVDGAIPTLLSWEATSFQEAHDCRHKQSFFGNWVFWTHIVEFFRNVIGPFFGVGPGNETDR